MVLILFSVNLFAATTVLDSGESVTIKCSAVSDSCNDASPDWTSCGNYVEKQYGNYKLYNSMWSGVLGSCMWGKSSDCWGSNATYSNGTGNVKAYAFGFRGYHYNLASSTSSGFPLVLSKPLIVTWNMVTPKAGRYMALWDLYFQKTATVENKQGDANIMLFQYIWDRDKWIGSDADLGSNAPTVTVGGLSWRYKYVAADPRVSGGPVIALYAMPKGDITHGVQSAKLDLKAIYDWAVSEKLIAAGMYLKGVEVGWELIESGPTLDGGKFQTKSFMVEGI